MAEMVKVYRKDLGFGQGYGGSNYYLVTKERAEELAADGYTTDPTEANIGRAEAGGSIYTGTDTPQQYGDNAALTGGGSSTATSDAQYAAAMDKARVLFQFFPEEVLKEFANKWVEFGDEDLAIAAARTTPAWEKEFGYLKRPDKTLIMTEIEAMAAKASYRETLAEVGIADTSQFEDDFNELIKGEVKATEFQARIDLVYDAVKDNIPQVEQMFRDRYQIDTDAPTIFAALISPTINDKLLKGDLKTIGVGAEGVKAGFTRTFAEFEALRKAGMTQTQARQMYSGAQSVIDVGARAGGRDIDISVVEQAALGSKEAQETLTLAAAETQGQSSMIGGARKKDGKVTGLLEQ